MTHPASNPIIYFWMNPNFRVALLHLLGQWDCPCLQPQPNRVVMASMTYLAPSFRRCTLNRWPDTDADQLGCIEQIPLSAVPSKDGPESVETTLFKNGPQGLILEGERHKALKNGNPKTTTRNRRQKRDHNKSSLEIELSTYKVDEGEKEKWPRISSPTKLFVSKRFSSSLRRPVNANSKRDSKKLSELSSLERNVSASLDSIMLYVMLSFILI